MAPSTLRGRLFSLACCGMLPYVTLIDWLELFVQAGYLQGRSQPNSRERALVWIAAKHKTVTTFVRGRRSDRRPTYWQTPPARHVPLQHAAFGPTGLHAPPVLRQEAASTAVGVTIEVTNGNATAAAMPTFLINSRRESL